jgi:predicted nuclease of restriction endonuclease-like (RecB) superfamily
MQEVKTDIIKAISKPILSDLCKIVDSSKHSVARVLSSSMTLLYWRIGERIKTDLIKLDRAEYGQSIIRDLSKNLSAEYGRGFTYTSLTRMVKFYEQISDQNIVATLSQQLTWSHIVELLPLEGDNKRNYYIYMSINEGWSVRVLRSNISRMNYERSSLAKKPTEITTDLIDNIRTNKLLSPDIVLKDPYCLDFLGLPDQHYETELENAILQQIESFLLELGVGFSFVSRQKRMTIDNEHFYLDLLLYNRKLKRLVAVELKTGHFKAAYKGQMELYLGWLRKHECFEGENPPIGIILCSEKSNAQIELLDMSSSGIHIAEYWSELPPIEVFEKKIQQIVLQAKRIH